MKIKLFTHNDLDGVGCAIVARLAFGDIVDVEYCAYKYINQKVLEFILGSDRMMYDHVYITDLSVNHEVAGLINKEMYKKPDQIILLDHHDSAKWLSESNEEYATKIFIENSKSLINTFKNRISAHEETLNALEHHLSTLY